MLLTELQMKKSVPEDLDKLPPGMPRVHHILLMDLALGNAVAGGNLNGKRMHGHDVTSETVELTWMFRSLNRAIRGSAGTQYSGGITPRAEMDPPASIAAMIVVG
jgi:hypothetical protein